MSVKTPVSVVVLTYNEELHLPHLLESVKDWAGEIIVVDSFSTDRTLEIAHDFGATVYQHAFENQARQFNWALDNVPIQFPWIFRLDSDELVPAALADEIREKLATLPADVTGVYLRRQVHFMGRWMRHGGYYPMWFLRLFREGAGRYEDITEEHIVLSQGRSVRFDNDFIDYNRKGLSFWTDKHSHWAVGEMLDVVSMATGTGLPSNTVAPRLLGTQNERRRWLKTRLYTRLPLFLRAFLFFLYRYFLRLGFLDGSEGLIFHFLQGCWYRFYVDAKIYEARRFGIDNAERALLYSASKPWEATAE